MDNKNQNSSAAKSTDNNPEYEPEYDYQLKENKAKSLLRPKTLSREKHGTLADMIAQFKNEMKINVFKKKQPDDANNSSGSFILAKTVTETEAIADILGKTQQKALKPAQETKVSGQVNVRKKLIYLDASLDSGGCQMPGPLCATNQDGVNLDRAADRHHNSRSHSAGRSRVNVPQKSPDKKIKKKLVASKGKSRGTSKEDKIDKCKEKDKSKAFKIGGFVAPNTQTKVFNKKSSRTNMKTESKTKNQSDGNILKNPKLLNPLKSTLEKEHCRGLLKSSKFREGLNSVENIAKPIEENEKSSVGNGCFSQNQVDKSFQACSGQGPGKKLDEGRIFSNASIKDSDKVESTKEEMKPGFKLSEVVGGKSEATLTLGKTNKAVEDLMQRLVKNKFGKRD